MPALNFIKEMAPKVELGLKEPDHPEAKRQSVRAFRKDGRDPKAGQTLYLYTGMRTKGCRKLGEATCKSVEQISIERDVCCDVIVGISCLTYFEMIFFAKADGFNSINEFIDFFHKTHGLPFYGLLIKW